MKPENSALSDLATDLRNRAGLSYEALALQTGYTRWTLGRYGNGETKIPIGYVAFLARALAQGHLGGERASAAVTKGLLKELNLAIESYYGKAAQLHSWEHLLKAADAWVEAKQKTPSSKDVSPALPWHLRAALPDFIGRTDELAQLVRALSNTGADPHWVGLACIRGLGGMGKTELAYRAASELTAAFPDGQLLLSLGGSSSTLATAEQLLQQALRAFTPQAQLPEARAELRAQYLTAMRGRRVLIVADDACDAAQLRDLTPPPGSALLITTRRRFPVDGLVDANTIELAGLDTEDAARLLHTLCPRLGENALDLAALCGHMPLALRIAGGRLASDGTLRVARYLAQLRDERSRLAALEEDEGEHSVVAALRLSYAALDPLAQAVLTQISVFPASFPREAMTGVVELAGTREELDVLLDQALSQLYRAGLVEIDPAGERVHLHDLVRVFAVGQLGDPATLRLRHAATYGYVARRLGEMAWAKGASLLQALAIVDRERLHFDLGIQWALQHADEPEAGPILVDYMVGLAPIGLLRLHPREVLTPLYTVALALGRRWLAPNLEMMALNNLGVLADWRGDKEEARRLYDQALALSSTSPDMRQAAVRHNLAVSVARQGYAVAVPGPEAGHDQGLLLRGMIARQRGAPEAAIKHAEAALALARQGGDLVRERIALCNLANAVIGLPPGAVTQEEQYALACSYANQGLVLAEQLGDADGRGDALAILGNAANVLGDPQVAISRYGEALGIFWASGRRPSIAAVLLSMGDAHRALHEVEQADAYYAQAIVENEAVGDLYGLARACWRYGALLLRLHEYRGGTPDVAEVRRAVGLWERAVALERELDSPDVQRHAKDLAQLRVWLAGSGASGVPGTPKGM